MTIIKMGCFILICLFMDLMLGLARQIKDPSRIEVENGRWSGKFVMGFQVVVFYFLVEHVSFE